MALQSPSAAAAEAALALWALPQLAATLGGSSALLLGHGAWLCGRLCIAGVLLARLREGGGKLWFLAASVTSVWSEPKLRFKGRALVSTVGLPLSLASLAAATALSAPLVPLLGCPLFVPGFPRPQRQWPATLQASNGSDAALYVQALPRILQLLRRLLPTGALGGARPGAVVLLRLEKMLVWVQVRGALPAITH